MVSPRDITTTQQFYRELNLAAIRAYQAVGGANTIALDLIKDGAEVDEASLELALKAIMAEKGEDQAFAQKLEEERKKVMGLDQEDRTEFNALMNRLTALHRVGTSSALVQQTDEGLKFYMLERIFQGERDGVGSPGGIAEKAPEKVGEQAFQKWYKLFRRYHPVIANIWFSLDAGTSVKDPKKVNAVNQAITIANQQEGSFLENLKAALQEQGFGETQAENFKKGIEKIIKELLPAMSSIQKPILSEEGKLSDNALKALKKSGGFSNEELPMQLWGAEFDGWYESLQSSHPIAASLLVSAFSGGSEQKEQRKNLNAALVAANKADGPFLANLQQALEEQGMDVDAPAIVEGVKKMMEEFLPGMKSLRGKVLTENGKLTDDALEMLEGGMDDIVYTPDGTIRRLDLSKPEDMALFAANDNSREVTEELGEVGKKIVGQPITLLDIPFFDVEWLILGKKNVLKALYLTPEDAITTPKVGLREVTGDIVEELNRFEPTSEVQSLAMMTSSQIMARWTIDAEQDKDKGIRYKHEPWAPLLAEIKFNGIEGLAKIAQAAQAEITLRWQQLGKPLEDTPVFSLEELLKTRGKTIEKLAEAIHRTLGEELEVDAIKQAFEGMDSAAQAKQRQIAEALKEAKQEAFETFRDSAEMDPKKAFEEAQAKLDDAWKEMQKDAGMPQSKEWAPIFQLSQSQWKEVRTQKQTKLQEPGGKSGEVAQKEVGGFEARVKAITIGKVSERKTQCNKEQYPPIEKNYANALGAATKVKTATGYRTQG